MRSNVLVFWTTATHICIVIMSTHMQINVYFIDYTSHTVINHCKTLLSFGIWCSDPCLISHYAHDEESFTVHEAACQITWFFTQNHFTSVRTIYPSSLQTIFSPNPNISPLRTTSYFCPNHSSKTINCKLLWARVVCHCCTYPYMNLGAFTCKSQDLKKYFSLVNVQSLIYREQSRDRRVCLHKWFRWKSTTCDDWHILD